MNHATPKHERTGRQTAANAPVGLIVAVDLDVLF